MTIIQLHKRYYAIPTTWNELSGKQLLQVMEVLYGNYEVDAARLKLLKILTGVSWFRFFRIPLAEKAAYLDITHFLVNENTLTKQLLPIYKGYYGPADDFNNITGEEFVFSEDFYFKSFTTNDDGQRIMNPAALNELVAVLYRKKKDGYNLKKNIDGDARESFNQNISTYNAKRKISKWPLAAKLAVFTWYETCRHQMIEANPDVFGGGSNEPAKYGLLSVMRVIAEGGIHGDFEKVTKMYVQLWMMELNEKIEEAKQAAKKE